jgi:hypothetical protein
MGGDARTDDSQLGSPENGEPRSAADSAALLREQYEALVGLGMKRHLRLAWEIDTHVVNDFKHEVICVVRWYPRTDFGTVLRGVRIHPDDARDMIACHASRHFKIDTTDLAILLGKVAND